MWPELQSLRWPGRPSLRPLSRAKALLLKDRKILVTQERSFYRGGGAWCSWGQSLVTPTQSPESIPSTTKREKKSVTTKAAVLL